MKAPIEQTSRIETKPRILVIADQPERLNPVGDNLESAADLTFVRRRTASAVCDSPEEQSCDLVLSDVELPDIDGFEICRRIKQNPKLRFVPIILMSGRLAEENEALALKLGAVDYVSKPFRMENIVNKVSAHIQGSEKRTVI
jgi:DNA-binding response OmpR family regulator